MSTFKTALRMALAHPFYLLIYTVFISGSWAYSSRPR